MASFASFVPVTGAYPFALWPSKTVFIVFTTSSAVFKFPNTVGSPKERETISLSGFGVTFERSTIFLIGFVVLLATLEASTFIQRCQVMRKLDCLCRQQLEKTLLYFSSFSSKLF